MLSFKQLEERLPVLIEIMPVLAADEKGNRGRLLKLAKSSICASVITAKMSGKPGAKAAAGEPTGAKVMPSKRRKTRTI